MPAALSYLALAAILGSLAGCHLVISHEPARSDPGQPRDLSRDLSRDRLAVDAGVDSATLDRAKQLDAPKPDAPKLDAGKGDGKKLDAKKLDGTKQPDAPKSDAKKLDAPKPDAPKPDSKKLDAPKPDSKKLDAPKLDTPPADTYYIVPFCVGGCTLFETCCIKPAVSNSPGCYQDPTGCECNLDTHAPCGGASSWCCNAGAGTPFRCTPNNTC